MSTTYHFPKPLFDHQRTILNRLIQTKGKCALLCSPGSGKTAPSLHFAGMLAVKQRVARVLVVAPVAALDTWLTQADDFLPLDLIEVRGEILTGSVPKRAERLAEIASEAGEVDAGERATLYLTVVNTETFQSRHKAPGRSTVTTLDLMLRAVEKYSPDLVIVDESHRGLKTPTSNTSKAMARLRDLAPRRVILTGTPMPHSPLDIFGQWRFLDPSVFADEHADGSFKPWSFGRFKNRYAVMGGWMNKQVIGFQRLDEMEARMASRSVVVRKEDALDLPPVTDQTIPVHLSPAEQKSYDQMQDHLVMELADGTLEAMPNRLVQMLRLRQLTSGYTTEAETHDLTRHGSSKSKVAADLVANLLGSERRVVVFAHFRPECADLHETITAKAGKSVEVELITGDTPPEERVRLRKRFGDLNNGPEQMVLVCQMRTMSLAVNELVTASYAIFASLSERRDDFVQARDRLDRIGQTRPVTFYYLMVPDSVDEVIYQSHRDRTNLEDALMAHLRKRDQ